MDLETLYKDTLAKLYAAKAENTMLTARIEGDKELYQSMRDSKIALQRKALNSLNKRVRVQRLQLRRLNELGRALSAEEWNTLKAEFSHEIEDTDFEEYK